MSTIFKTLEFPVEKPSDENIKLIRKQLKNQKKGNGLFLALYVGYSNHIPISIRPDDVLNNIISIWSKYIVLHAEKFREFFVNHSDKKELVYKSGGTYQDDRIQEFMDGMIKLVVKDQGNKITWASSAKFSTTSIDDNMLRAAATLASQKEYYDYGWTLMCGFSQIHLEGTKKDWSDLIGVVEKMPVPDDGLAKWRDTLINTIQKMVEGTEDFWQTCVTEHPYGSGSQSKKNGWILAFNPINEKGEWVDILKDKEILDLQSDFDVHVNDNGVEFDIKIEAGPVSISLTDKLSVYNKVRLVKQEKVSQ